MSSKVDVGDQMTEKELAKLEKQVADVYKQARDDLQDDVNAYFADLEKRARKKQAQLEAGEITEAEYTRWLMTQTGRGKRYEALRDKMAERYTKANETAAAYINDKTAGIYSLNRSYAAYEIDTATGGKLSAESFVIYDEQTVKRLVVEQPDLMPYYPEKRAIQRGIDLAYGKQQITANITSGILTGKSIPHIADDLQTYITDMSRESAVRAARTSFTAAQNGGRQASYEAAADMGIKVRKRWVCTKDRRTRTEHGQADGQTVDFDKCFDVGGEQLMYPGDNQHGAHGWNLYNCRCAVRTVEGEGLEAEPRKIRVRDSSGRNVLVSEMTYTQWLEWVNDGNQV